jgi:hypothetical protein
VRRRPDVELARKLGEIAYAAPHVMAHRLARLASSGAAPSRRDRTELRRMTEEKVGALWDGWAASATAVMSYAFTGWQQALMQFPGALWLAAYQAWLSALASGLAPMHRRVLSNHRRLTRR